MKHWLKNIRLHKYTSVLTDMKYDELLNLNEQKLKHFQITSGASKKFLTHIERVKTREEMLKLFIEVNIYTNLNMF